MASPPWIKRSSFGVIDRESQDKGCRSQERFTMNSTPDGKIVTHEGRVAVVTGAGRGIGQAICRGLAARGATVVAVDIGDLSETESIVRSAQRDWLGLHADVAAPEDTRRVAN